MVKLRIVGDGELRTQCEAIVRQENLNIEFTGMRNRSAVLKIIANAEILIVPSEWYEGFPMTIAESLACGTPLICSKLGAMEEIIADSRTGLHFTPGDAEDLAQKIIWAFDHPSEIATMGRAARREYEVRYTSERSYAQLMTIYEETVTAYA